MIFGGKKIDFPMTDMHIHILPETDDGAKDIKVAVAMLEIAVEDGINTLVTTTHYHPGKCELDQSEVKERTDKFLEIAKQLYPEFNIYAGREVYYNSDVADSIRQRNLTINNTRYVLVEFDFGSSAQTIMNGLRNIINDGMIPIIAHIERYMSICEDYDFATDIKEMGAYIQINASSITGDEGADAKRFARKLLKEELVDVIATDAHSAGHRAPRMKKSVQWVIDKCGYEYAKRIAKDNPDRIINNEFLD